MRGLSTAELLSVWERGVDQSPLQRALLLLSSACPETSPEKLSTLSIGQRDAQLLGLREQIFGAKLISVLKCLKCDQRLELTFDVADLRATPTIVTEEPLFLEVDGFALRFRLPDSLDLAAIAQMEPTVSRRVMLQRCLLASHRNDQELSADDLPEHVVQAIAVRMAEADPQADVQIAITCPVCENGWQSSFDIVSYFWNEIDAWAQRVLREVHTLASAYGWREADILAMSPWRRQHYLTMIGK
jgi:hypothetical protein